MLGGLAYQNNFLLIGHGQPFIRYFHQNQKEELARVLCGEEDILYARHIYFMDLKYYGCQVKYFNMVRIVAVFL